VRPARGPVFVLSGDRPLGGAGADEEESGREGETRATLTPRYSTGCLGVASGTRLEWTLVLCCVVLAVLFGLVCAFDEDGDLSVSLCRADGFSCARDEVSRAVPAGDASRRPATLPARLRLSAPGLLAAVPGGLCLLI